jgi:HD superfamily phosphodiesterase
MFEQLVSPEQKQLSATVAAKGGVKALRNNDKMLLELERKASEAPSASSAEGHRAPRSQPGDANQNADDLRTDIFEDPDAAVEKNQTVYFRKFEAQKRQIIDELTLVVKRESDRVIQEIKSGPHERILDRVRAFYTLLKRVVIS